MAVATGIAYWTSVLVPNETFEPVYTVDLVISDEDAQDFASRGVNVNLNLLGRLLLSREK